jgi:hypothetical protein
MAPGAEARFTPADRDAIEALRQDLTQRTGRLILATFSEIETGQERLELSVRAMPNCTEDDGPVHLASILAAPGGSASLVAAARFAAMRHYRTLCRGQVLAYIARGLGEEFTCPPAPLLTDADLDAN